MSGDTFKKAFTYSNPLTAAIDVAEHATGKDYSPKVKYKGITLYPASLVSPVSTIGEGMSVAGQQDGLRKAAKEQEKMNDALDSDEREFQKFKAQESNLLQNGASTELFTPQYKTGKRKAETDALAAIFQARKDQAQQRNTRPGVAQTRSSMGAL
jgi:hypothetical protein